MKFKKAFLIVVFLLIINVHNTTSLFTYFFQVSSFAETYDDVTEDIYISTH